MMRRRGGVVRGVARTAAVAGTASAVSGRVHHRQQEKWAEQNQQDAYDAQAAYQQGVADAQAAPPAPASLDFHRRRISPRRGSGLMRNLPFCVVVVVVVNEDGVHVWRG